MRKRERENPCGICGHYHKYEEGEVCGICGHRTPVSSDKTSLEVSAFPSVILPDFLYLGSYDNASRSELLKTQGITRVLNTVPACQNLYKNSFTYHCLQDDKILQFDDAIQFLEQCERDKARVLAHCMSGKNRSPAIVIAFLMKSKGWRLPQSYQWVKERRPSVDISQAIYQQLQEYEQKLFGSSNNSGPALLAFQPAGAPFNFGFSKADDPVPVPVPIPAFGNLGTPSIFARPPLEVPPHEFTFGAGQTQKSISENLANPGGSDIPMDNT
ncbi:DUAL SPECIFICITY PROTEIN PHOSPHATASE 1E, indole-3-butyric acid response 5 [Hibiscus trionum]|uniref:DUAL SPECIFICITY PROTEIN PHOSPHATASE 1E, indole-3-butyric acid response 5 n=1 Tax=Hibiscus trionum TaxID=183268 RepID=A0A9W7IR18_HIBTR|nr:DUAL SPECIFICITY PROTEIN PHOSPHATASE 1E, indole-3-butyric acid response 5 [Hibiscus trionum]